MAKRASTPPRTSVSRKTTVRPGPADGAHSPTHDEIAQRAFALYVARGRGDGSDVNDWLLAESELARHALVGP
jgi:hypothetical protein